MFDVKKLLDDVENEVDEEGLLPKHNIQAQIISFPRAA
jgi:hypothetical protein